MQVSAKTDQRPRATACELYAFGDVSRGAWAHQRRLENLKRAASLQKETADGFVFAVDLRKMPLEDLQLWMANEQKCCSFLRMNNRLLKKDILAEVVVACPSEMRVEVMQTFGLRAINEKH